MLRKILLIGVVLTTSTLMLHCSQTQKQTETTQAPVYVERPVLKGLSQQQALQRSSRISNVHYDLNFNITNDKIFSGVVTSIFDLKNKDLPITVDFGEGVVKSVDVNGKPVTTKYNGLFLAIPPGQLVEGSNKITIQFEHPYSKSGNGLYRFIDPEDKQVYMYTDFEPYDANLLFPCFDQPDLKATYTLNVTAPAHWQVVSSTRESDVKSAGTAEKQWTFPKSARFSTYLFSLHAGPYKVWEAQAGAVPLRLFARQSLAKFIDPDEWFTITRQGLNFFGNYFDYAYPFAKYDQLIVPDFNAGAMENVAAVTFSERYVFRGQPTIEDRENRAEVILHEMAHMWFGNLVTMKWWNDLWLNESFASYMASLAAFEATEFKKSWNGFFADMKQWAYWEDQLVTTHPIESEVPDTVQAFVNFDGITYGKGASVLKQLSFYLGPDRFRNGVRKYFQKFEYQNAELKDFMEALESASGQDLKGWTNEWLRTAGLNTIEAKYECKNEKISSFALHQSAPKENPALRSHRTQIGLYIASGDTVREFKVLPVTYSGAVTSISTLIGQPCPLMVYPNHGDYDYVKVSLDGRTIRATQTHISKVENTLTRMMLWSTLWDMVRDQQLHLLTYSDLILENASSERELKNLSFILGSIYGRYANSPSVLHYLPRTGSAKVRYIERIEQFFWSNLERAQPGTDFQKLWFDSYTKVAQNKKAQKHLLQILQDKIAFSGLTIDQDRRWAIIRQLNAFGVKGSDALIRTELKRDPSEKGAQSALAAEVVQPQLANKRQWFSTITATKPALSLARLRVAMRNLFPSHQEEARERFTQDFFTQLLKLAPVRENEFLSSYAENLAPAVCQESSVKRLGDFVLKHSSLSPVVLKELKVALQEDERCVRIREFSRAENGNPSLRSMPR